MKKVRAKFICGSVIDASCGSAKVVHMNAVYSDKGENKDFTDSTPSGNLDLVINNDAPASEYFEQGKEYYIDITAATASDDENPGPEGPDIK